MGPLSVARADDSKSNDERGSKSSSAKLIVPLTGTVVGGGTRGPRQSPGRPRGGIMSRLDCSAGASGTMTTMRTRYHFSGVGGAGMSPLARLMRARGHAVQGSDRAFDAGKNREAADTL